jgi:hypothetical protein
MKSRERLDSGRVAPEQANNVERRQTVENDVDEYADGTCVSGYLVRQIAGL